MSSDANYNNIQRSVMEGAGSAIKRILSRKGGRRTKKGGVRASTMIGVYVMTLMAVAVMSQYGIIPSIDVVATAVMEAAGLQARKVYDPTFMRHVIENLYIFFAYPGVDPANRPAFCSDKRGAVTSTYQWAEGFDKFDATCADGADAAGVFLTGALLAMVTTIALSTGLTLKAFTADKAPPKPQTAEMSVQAASIDDTQGHLRDAWSALDQDITDPAAIAEVREHTLRLMAAVHESPAFKRMEEQLAAQLAVGRGESPQIDELSDETAVIPKDPEYGSSMFSCLTVRAPNILASLDNGQLLATTTQDGADQQVISQKMSRGGRKNRKRTKKHKRRPKRRYTKRR